MAPASSVKCGGPLFCQLVARRILVFLDDPVGDLIHDWLLLQAGRSAAKQCRH
jgi:hypothetical protein